MTRVDAIAPAALMAVAIGSISVFAANSERLAATERSAVSSQAQSSDGLNRRVRVHNNTRWTMTRFQASNSRVTDWDENMLGPEALPAGRSIMMNIDDGSGACLYDFRAGFSNGQELTRRHINVCQIVDYHFTR